MPIIQAAGVVGNCEDAPTLNAFASRGQASRDWKLLVFKVTQVISGICGFLGLAMLSFMFLIYILIMSINVALVALLFAAHVGRLICRQQCARHDQRRLR